MYYVVVFYYFFKQSNAKLKKCLLLSQDQQTKSCHWIYLLYMSTRMSHTHLGLTFGWLICRCFADLNRFVSFRAPRASCLLYTYQKQRSSRSKHQHETSRASCSLPSRMRWMFVLACLWTVLSTHRKTFPKQHHTNTHAPRSVGGPHLSKGAHSMRHNLFDFINEQKPHNTHKHKGEANSSSNASQRRRRRQRWGEDAFCASEMLFSRVAAQETSISLMKRKKHDKCILK